MGAKPNTDPVVTIEEITPEMARAYLERNTRNRRLVNSTVEAYARDLKDGSWMLTGESVKFDWDGKLADGQHRLNSIIEAGRAMKTIVVRNLDPQVIKNVDNGRKRWGRDYLQIEGVPHAKSMASCAHWLLAVKLGNLNKRVAWTNTEVVAMCKKHRRELSYSIDFCMGKRPPMSLAMLAVIHWMATKAGHQDAAERFINVLREGGATYENDPAHALRERLLRERIAGRRLHSKTLFYSAIHAFNAFKNNQPMQRIFLQNGIVEMDGFDAECI